MAQLAVLERVSSKGRTSHAQYDKDKWGTGSLIKRVTNLGTPFIGPIINAVGRPVETVAAIPGIYPHAIPWCDKDERYSTGTVGVSSTAVTGAGGAAWITAGIAIGTRIGFGSTDADQITTWYNIDSVNSNTSITLSSSAGTISSGTPYVIENFKQIDWIFLVDNAAAAATRRVQLYEFDRNTSQMSWKGFVTMTMNAGGNQTARGLRVLYQKYSTGTVAVATATVTGTGTLWQTNKICAGNSLMSSRIGFGSTDPSQIKTWYYINTITAEGTMTISTSALTNVAANITISAGTAYVIEDLKILMVTTCATVTNGGIFMVKGASYAHFLPAGTTYAYAATTDNIVEVIWLKDAATQTNTNACGIALGPFTDMSNQFVYVLDVATVKIFKYNVRAGLTIASGNSVSAFVLATGNQAVTGTIAQNNNGRFYTAGHGPASGLPALYFVTTTRIYACLDSAILSGATNFLTYQMTENPPGGTVTFPLTGQMACIETYDAIDRLIIISTGANCARSYVTSFRTDGGQMDHIFLVDDKQIDQSTVDANTTPHPSIRVVTQSPSCEKGVLYLAGVGTGWGSNIINTACIGADWTYSNITGEYATSPKLSTPNCVKFITPFAIRDTIIGGNDVLGKRADAMRFSYRTTGIDDNSGSWTVLSEPYDMSGVAGAEAIQFKIEFKGISDFCVPGRLYGIGIVYEDASTDSHYRFSGGLSSAANKRFAFRFANSFGSTVPRLRIRLYNDVTNSLLLDDDSVTQAATWEKSTNDGGSWGAYDTTDKANDTTYIRVTYATLGDNIKVRAVLTLY